MSTETAAVLPTVKATGQTALSDGDLVSQVQHGDAEAFSVLVERHQHLVYNLACRFMRDATQAEDMTQEAFLKAYRLIHGFRGDCRFSTWLYRVTASVCLTELNHRKKRCEVALLPFHVQQAPDEPCDAFDMRDLMRACVAKLSPHYARVITLYYLRETPYEEIAKRMRIPMGTLKTWMHRARKQLRKIVEKELGSYEAREA